MNDKTAAQDLEIWSRAAAFLNKCTRKNVS